MAKSGGKTDQHTVVRRMQIRQVEDDLSAMTVEYQEPTPQGRRRRLSRRVGTSYLMVDTVALAQLRLSHLEWRILSVMLSRLDRGTNDVRMNQELIGKKAGMLPSAVSRTMPHLVGRNVVVKLAYGHYQVTPWIAYVGEWREWNSAAGEWPEPIWDASS